jgi:chromosomal replication initiation ATPase DnaA
MLFGRERESARIDEALDAAKARRSGALVVRGEAGIGKSALLNAAMERADRMQVLRARGVESEVEIAFSGLHELLRPRSRRSTQFRTRRRSLSVRLWRSLRTPSPSVSLSSAAP